MDRMEHKYSVACRFLISSSQDSFRLVSISAGGGYFHGMWVCVCVFSGDQENQKEAAHFVSSHLKPLETSMRYG